MRSPLLIWVRRGIMVMAMLLAVPAIAADQAYASYDALLKQHVRWLAGGNGSVVDYDGLQRDRARLKSVLQTFSQLPPAEFARWNRAEQMSFLINAYNAFTLELILTRYPDLQSIRDLGSLLRSPWKQPFFTLLGESRTLDWIEHERLRPVYGEPRLHFAVNCASVGCPALRPEAYTAAQLEAQLQDQTQRFLGDRSRNRLNAANGVLSVSAIFKWFAEDFDRQGGVKAWLMARADLLAASEPERARLRRGDFRLDYLSYDWSLNRARPAP